MADMNLGTLVAKLKLDGADQYNRDVTQARNAFTDLADAAQRADRQAGQMRSPRGLTEIRTDADKARAAVSDIGDGAQKTSTKLSGVSDGMSRARQQIASDAQAARRDVEQIGDAARSTSNSVEGSAGRIGNAFRSSLEGIGAHAGEAGGDSGGAFIAGFAPRIAQLGTKGGPIGIALAGAAVIGVGAGALLASAVSDGFTIQSERSFAQTKFGLTNEQMEQAGVAAGNAYGQTFGASVKDNIETAGVAMQTGLINGTATADQMQPVIQSLTTVSELMGTEIPETAQAAGQMVKTGLVKNSAEAMDLLIVAQQKGLNQNGDLLDSVGEYSSQWQKLGIDGKTALGTIAQMQTAGVRNTDLAADALKEFSIRAVDGSQSTKDAFTSLGLDADQAGQAFAAGGDQALGMSRTVLLALANVKDPMERNRIGTELMGTQWEDTGKAINKLDLTKARDELGKVDGAAKNAGDNLSSGPGAAIEKLHRQIEVFSDGIKLKLADAFGPAVEQLTNGLMAHKDEIMKFATDVIGGFLQLGIAAGNVAAGLLHVWGWTTGELGKIAGKMLNFFGGTTKLIGEVVSHIPGMQSVGNAIRSAGEMAQGAGHMMEGMGDAAHGAANFIADNLVPALANAKKSLHDIPDHKPITIDTPGGNQTLQLLGQLNAKVHVDNEKNIVVDAPLAPAVIEKLKQIGVEVQTNNGKTILVKADDADYQNKKSDWTQTIYKRIIPQTSSTPADTRPTPLYPNLTGHASGGQVFGPGGPKDDRIITALSNREWVQPVDAVDYYGNAFMSDVQHMRFPRIPGYADGGQVGYGLPAGSSGSDGFPDWITQLGAAHGVKPATYAGHQESDRNEAGYAPNPQHLNRGIDWSGSVADMQAFAEYMMGQAVNDPSIEQVIWMNPQTGQKLGWHGRQPDTDGSYFASDYAGHTDHVHTRFSAQVGAQTGGTQGGIRDITLGPNASRDDVARKIIAEGRKRGYSDDQIADVLSMAIQESNLDPEAQNSNWKGIFQQDSSYPGRDDPNTQITGFYDRLDSKKGTPGWSQDMDQNLFWVQQAPGADSAQAAVANGRGAYMDEINSHQDEATKMVTDLGPSVGTLDTTGAAATPSGATQNVYVTGGRLDSVGTISTPSTTTPTTTTSTPTKDDPSKLKPSGPLPIVAYAEGGWGDRPDAAQMLNNANAWVTLAGEAGREAFIPINGSDKSKNLWLQAGRELGMVRAYAGGGFGGYAEDTSDWMAPKSWMDYAYLAAGAGFTAASVIGPYAQMAAAGQVTLGDLAPQPSTSSNDIPGLSEALNQQIEVLSKQLEELRKLRAEGKTPHIVVEDQKGLLEKTGIHLAAM